MRNAFSFNKQPKYSKGIEQQERWKNKNVGHALKTVTSHRKYSFVLTKMSELNCNGEDGLPEVCQDEF